MILVLMAVFGFFASDAADIPSESLLVKNYTTAIVNEVIKFNPKPGYHFNMKAPQQCGTSKVADKTATEIQCQFSSSGDQKILLNICDDAETFCKPERSVLKVSAPKGYINSTKSSRQNTLYVPKGERPAPPGFLQNNPRAALDQAKHQKKLLFIDFYAHWCPSCNMLDETVFEDKNFKENTKDFVKVKMDVDSDISWEWKEKFRVGGYPTLVIANADLEEISRMVGYRPVGPVVAWLASQKTATEPALVAEKAIRDFEKNPNTNEIEQNNTRKLRVGQWYYDRAEYEKAVSFLEALTMPAAIRLKKLAELKLLKSENSNSNNSVKMVEAYEKLLSEYPDDVEYTGWVDELTSLDKEKGRKYSALVEKNISLWSESGKLDNEDYNLADLKEEQADMLTTLGDTEKAKEKYANCAAFYEVEAAKSNLKVARGANLERAYCLLNAGESAKAKDLYKQMATAYHGEFAFSYNFARALFELNDLKSAYSNVKLAYANSYGDNFLRAAALKAKIEMKMNKASDAKKTITESIAKMYLPASTQLRSHRYYSQLKDLLNDVDKTKTLQKQ